MLFLPPVVPPLSFGRFQPTGIKNIKQRCTEANHPYPRITQTDCPNLSTLDGFLWSYDHNRIQVQLPPHHAGLRLQPESTQ